MNSKKMRVCLCGFMVLLACLSLPLKAQEQQNLINTADSLYQSYNFERAKMLYKNLIKMEENPRLRSEMELKAIACDNGEAMLGFITTPKVVARRSLPRRDFYLYYPDIAKQGAFVSASVMREGQKDTVYIASQSKTLYFSAKGPKGNWNIYMARLGDDGVWGEPMELNGNVNSQGNELFPFLSPDGTKLYFSSDGNYGAGGYDLYVSEWDAMQGGWSTAQNLGFPYSSPADDFFYYITPDNRYAVFASTRGRARDGRVAAYVVEHESNPTKRAATPQEAAAIAQLKNTRSEDDKASASRAVADQALKGLEYGESLSPVDSASRANTDNYKRISLRFRELQAKIQALALQQQRMRATYAAAVATRVPSDSVAKLAGSIGEQEQQMLALQDSARSASAEIRKIEENFLTSGAIAPALDDFAEAESSPEEARHEHTLEVADFLAEKASVIENVTVQFTRPVIVKDLSFKILAKSEMAEATDLPSGLVYQIRLFALAKKAGVAAFKGVSPIFCRTASGKYVYFAGVFEGYAEAAEALARVKKKGFATASVAAYRGGKLIPLASARKVEKEIAESVAYKVSIGSFEAVAPEEVLVLLRGCGKDIAKAADEGGVKYIIGPFASAAEANTLASKLKAISAKKIAVEKTAKY